MDQIENIMNALTDMDWDWWPVLFLRPVKDKDIDNMVWRWCINPKVGAIRLIGVKSYAIL
jgi:hypothetical protein